MRSYIASAPYRPSEPRGLNQLRPARTQPSGEPAPGTPNLLTNQQHDALTADLHAAEAARDTTAARMPLREVNRGQQVLDVQTKVAADFALLDGAVNLARLAVLGVAPSDVKCTATDRYRLATGTLAAAGTTSETVLILGLALAKVMPHLSGDEIRIGVDAIDDSTWVTIASDTTSAQIRALDGQYPTVASVLDQTATRRSSTIGPNGTKQRRELRRSPPPQRSGTAPCGSS